MPITTDFTPAGLLATLARSTGANQGRQQRRLVSNDYAMKADQMAQQDDQFTRSLASREQESALDRLFRQSLTNQQNDLTLQRDKSQRDLTLTRDENQQAFAQSQQTAMNARVDEQNRLKELNRGLADTVQQFTSDNGYSLEDQATGRKTINSLRTAINSGRYDDAQQEALIAGAMEKLEKIQPTQPKAMTPQEEWESSSFTTPDGLTVYPKGKYDVRPTPNPEADAEKLRLEQVKIDHERKVELQKSDTKAWDDSWKLAVSSFGSNADIDYETMKTRATDIYNTRRPQQQEQLTPEQQLDQQLRDTVQQLRDDSESFANSPRGIAQKQADETKAEVERFDGFTQNIYAALADPRRYDMAGSNQEIARKAVAQAAAILKSSDATEAQRQAAQATIERAAKITGVTY